MNDLRPEPEDALDRLIDQELTGGSAAPTSPWAKVPKPDLIYYVFAGALTEAEYEAELMRRSEGLTQTQASNEYNQERRRVQTATGKTRQTYEANIADIKAQVEAPAAATRPEDEEGVVGAFPFLRRPSALKTPAAAPELSAEAADPRDTYFAEVQKAYGGRVQDVKRDAKGRVVSFVVTVVGPGGRTFGQRFSYAGASEGFQPTEAEPFELREALPISEPLRTLTGTTAQTQRVPLAGEMGATLAPESIGTMGTASGRFAPVQGVSYAPDLSSVDPFGNVRQRPAGQTLSEYERFLGGGTGLIPADIQNRARPEGMAAEFRSPEYGGVTTSIGTNLLRDMLGSNAPEITNQQAFEIASLREELAAKGIPPEGIRDAIAAAAGVSLSSPQKLRGSSREYKDSRNYASGGTRLLPERTWLIGDSGEVYGVAAEAGKQEKITFEPTGKDIKKGTEGGFQEYQTGGTAYTSPYSAAGYENDFRRFEPYNPWPGTPYSTAANPQAEIDAASQSALAQQQIVSLQNQIERFQQPSAVNARALSLANSQIAGLQSADVATRQQELGQLQAAQANIPAEAADLSAQRRARVGDYKYGLAGLQLPYEVTPPLSGDMSYRLPLGLRYGFETPAQRLARQIEFAQAQRTLGIGAAQARANQVRYPSSEEYAAPAQEANALTTVGQLARLAGRQGQEIDLTTLMRAASSGDWSGIARLLGLPLATVEGIANATKPVLGAVA